jgi:abortive infection bacteriophage resistance protein
MATPYNKPFLTVPQQVALLRSRGLDVGADADAEALLNQFGYYRLSGYWHPLRQSEWDVDSASIIYKEEFKPGSTLVQATALAEFDRRLRSLFLEAIERIEVGIRVRVALLFGSRGPFTHRDANQYYPKFTTTPDLKPGGTSFDAWLDRVDSHEKRSKEQFALHFREKYGLPLPLWVSIEVWDFGMLSRAIGGMKIADQKALSTPLGLSRTGLFPSWLRAINHVRNICAHYSRLWNRSPSDQAVPPKPGEHPLLDHLATDAFAHVRLYVVAAIIQFLLRQIDGMFATQWSNALKMHFATFPTIVGVPVGQSGFPPGWEAQALWN